MLSVLLEHLRGGGRSILDNIRKARDAAATRGQEQTSGLLGTHLVVELSLLGNSRYRSGEFDSAIACYREAIDLCDLHGSAIGETDPRASSGVQPFAGCSRENLVRLRYNLARAFHRSDRWNEAREQATAVLALDRDYVNAYALRAQAAMASLDWQAAKADWDRLSAISERGSAAMGIGQEVARAWRRRREECVRQLAQDHYEALGLHRLATCEAVRRAYRDLARRWHPDKHQSRSQDHQERANRRFGRIREAYEVLGDEASKRNYDTELLLQEARPLSPGHLGNLGRAGTGFASAGPQSSGRSRDPMDSAGWATQLG